MKFRRFDFEEVSSTLDTAADARYVDGDLIVARAQSAGRGQRGNKWSSRAGENLTFTLVIEPREVRVCEQFTVSMRTALAVVGALGALGVEALVKWPNDIYVGERKICGILIEHSFSSEYLDRSLLGVGINVSQREFDPAAANPVSLAMLGVEVSTDEVLGLFCEHFTVLGDLIVSELYSRYMSKLYRGEGFFAYAAAASGERFEARIAAIDPFGGAITLERRDGTVVSYYFKEISFL